MSGGVQYAVGEEGTHLAYRVLEPEPPCANPPDLVFISPGLVPVEIFEEEAGLTRLLDGLRGLGRLTVFDRRGIGLSDPITDWQRPVLDQWADDLATVINALDLHNVVIISSEGYGIGSRFVAQHPERVAQIVIYDPFITPEEDWEEVSGRWFDDVIANLGGERDLLEFMAPSRANDPTFRDWYDRAGRMGASPATARRVWDSVQASRPGDHRLDQITVPTLVLHRKDNPIAPKGTVSYLLEQIPDATCAEVDGADAFMFAGDVDPLIGEIADFVVGERRVPPPQRLLAAVMFTDLVGSTARAASLGDAQWKALLDRHDTATRAAVGRTGGTVVKTTGDGVLATFPSATAALTAAMRLQTHLADDDLQIRVGLHVGEIDRRGDDISGLAVNIAARVMSLADDGGVAVTAPVVAALVGQATKFESMGSHELKGIPGTWDLCRVVL